MKQDEDLLQMNCYTWFHNKFPHLRGLLCYNLNNSKHAYDGRKNKAMGLQKGRADMVMYINATAYMIEFKTPTGTQQGAQKKWEALIKENGFAYYIVRTLEEFKILIKKILDENKINNNI